MFEPVAILVHKRNIKYLFINAYISQLQGKTDRCMNWNRCEVRLAEYMYVSAQDSYLLGFLPFNFDTKRNAVSWTKRICTWSYQISSSILSRSQYWIYISQKFHSIFHILDFSIIPLLMPTKCTEGQSVTVMKLTAMRCRYMEDEIKVRYFHKPKIKADAALRR